VLKEQGLGNAGALDPATAAKVGKILGIRYIILGGIDKFNIDNTKGGIGTFGVGGNMVQSNATINLRFVDTTTAERIISISADGNQSSRQLQDLRRRRSIDRSRYRRQARRR